MFKRFKEWLYNFYYYNFGGGKALMKRMQENERRRGKR